MANDMAIVTRQHSGLFESPDVEVFNPWGQPLTAGIESGGRQAR